MNKQKQTPCLNFVETLSQEFNGHYFYGIEFILDELFEDNNEQKNSQDNNSSTVDWFGLSDLII